MKIRFNVVAIALILMLIFVSLVGAQSYQLYFEDANRAYLEGRYEDAIQKYQQIIENNMISGEVYFNLGNSYYKLNQYGRSILYYEKAAHLLPGDEALQTNLKLARLHTVDEIEPIPQLFLKMWWDELLNLFSLDLYAWVTALLFVVASILIAAKLIGKLNIIRWIWTTGILFMIVLILFLNKVYIFESSEFGIILSPKVSIVSEPNISGKEIFILHEGTKVEIRRTLDNWYEIKIADGKTGWLQMETVELI